MADEGWVSRPRQGRRYLRRSWKPLDPGGEGAAGYLLVIDDQTDQQRRLAGTLEPPPELRLLEPGLEPLADEPDWYVVTLVSLAANILTFILVSLLTRTSERSGRAIDHDQAGSMEQKKREGYF